MPAKFPFSLWMDTVQKRKLSQELKENLSCDCVIVGSGYTGLRAALMLAEANLNVVVADTKDVGWGASGRNGGQVNPMLPLEKPNDLLKTVGSTYFERLAEISLNSADELFDLIGKYKIDCDARQNGWLRVNHCEKARIKWYEAAKAWNKFGAGLEFPESDDVKTLSGSNAYESGIVSPKGGAVHPVKLVHGLAEAATDAGAKIFANAKVTTAIRRDGKWVLKANGQKLTSDWVILATNGYTDELLRGLKQTIIPLVSVQIASEPLSQNLLATILPQGHTISDTRRVIMYARREPDNRIVFGSIGHKKFTGKLGGYPWLHKDVVRVFPQLKNVNWEYEWGGQIAFTQDHIPHFHEPHPGMVVGLGYNGRGVAMSHVMGRVLAERVLGKRPESLPFPVSAISKIPFKGIQEFGSPIAVGLMKALDRLEI